MDSIENKINKVRNELCKTCANRNNEEDLCNITFNTKREAQCVNYKCLTKKCHGCKKEKKCFDKEK